MTRRGFIESANNDHVEAETFGLVYRHDADGISCFGILHFGALYGSDESVYICACIVCGIKIFRNCKNCFGSILQERHLDVSLFGRCDTPIVISYCDRRTWACNFTSFIESS